VDLKRAAHRKTPDGPPAAVSKTHRAWMPWAVAGMATATVAAGLWFYLRGTAQPDNPLEGARYTQLTDYPGDETGAALSPDGKWVLFVSDKDGANDVWVERVGTGNPQNLSQGTYAPHSRTNRDGGFTGDGSEVWLAGAPPPTNRLGLIPLTGGPRRPFLDDKAGTMEWSRDGTRLLYFRNIPGDPIFIADRDGANFQQVYIAPAGVHNHFPAWSTDGKWIYFVHGDVVNFQFDLWRIAAAGGQPEQLTHHNNFVGYPTPMDARTVLYVAEDQDGGPWLFALDVESKTTRRISSALDRYTSLSASTDGRRLVASVAHPAANLWSIPILDDRLAGETDAKQFPVPNVRALAPRFGGNSVFYLSSQGGSDGLWRRDQDGQASEIWKGSQGAILEAPAISWDGKQAAVVLRNGGKQNLRVIAADGSVSQSLADAVDVRGSAAWSPDGTSIVTGGDDGHGPGLFKIPLDKGAPAKLAAGPAFNPVWSPKGDIIVYRGANTGVQGSLVFVQPDGGPVDLPPIKVTGENASARFLPDGTGLIYSWNSAGSLDFWILDLATRKTRQISRLNNPATMRAFDITPDGKQIVFDRLRENSDLVLIDLPRAVEKP
jgi:Tol biopolymer transport system component